jgi:hypothetical protein
LKIRITNRIINTNAKPPQNGRVTHHQDQVITLHNFSITKATPRSPNTPIPELEEFEFFDILIGFIFE